MEARAPLLRLGSTDKAWILLSLWGRFQADQDPSGLCFLVVLLTGVCERTGVVVAKPGGMTLRCFAEFEWPPDLCLAVGTEKTEQPKGKNTVLLRTAGCALPVLMPRSKSVYNVNRKPEAL